VWSPAAGEDILTINVWVPEGGGSDRPVLVWIYGGAFSIGCADTYDPVRLVRSGLVVVTFNYRVGFEGFGHVPGAPDNRGLLDQVAALRWVRDNIAAFGGAPDNVTVAGESAGATAVAMLTAMPAATGLFRRGIAHSVAAACVSVEAAAAVTTRIAAAADVPATRDALVTTPPGRLVEAAAVVLAAVNGDPSAGRLHYTPTIFEPVLDGDVLPAMPLHALAAGTARDVDLLFLHTTEEFRLFIALGMAPKVTTEAELAAVAAACRLSAEGLAEYRALVPDATVADVYAMLLTDVMFGEYTTRLAETAARAGGRAFLSRFAWPTPAFGAPMAGHGMDLPFIFGDLSEADDITRFILGGSVTAAHLGLADRMVRAWVDFATTGDPGWAPVTAETTPVKVWDLTDGMVVDTGAGTRAVWKGFDYTPWP
jgi:para-nitrobenzyl esterase